jgi:multiple sugar transport system permease protein
MTAVPDKEPARAQRPRRNKRSGPVLAEVMLQILMLGLAAVFLLPFWWMLISAFKTNAEIFTTDITWFPDPIRWENVTDLFTRPDFPFVRQFWNSVFYAGMVTLGTLLSCSVSAYAFGCLRWKGRDLVFGLTIATLLIPAIVTFLPTYIAFARMGLVGTWWPLIAPAFLGEAFYIFMLRQFFLGVPRELIDAARLDGASEFRIFWQIVLPQVQTALVVVALFTIVYTWHEFFGPLIYLQDRDMFPLSLGLFNFRTQRAVEWPTTMMGSLFTALPLILLFLFTRRLFQEGLATSSLK